MGDDSGLSRGPKYNKKCSPKKETETHKEDKASTQAGMQPRSSPEQHLRNGREDSAEIIASTIP